MAVDETLLQLGHADPADDVVEEAVHDESARLFLLDAAALQVEQVLVVEPAGGGRVAGTLDLAGLDLQVRHRVGVGAVGEHEVVVLLERVDALGHLADQDVADPDRVGVLALQRAPVVDVAARVRSGVVDEQAVLHVLAGVGEVDAEHLDAAAGADVVGRRAGAHDVAAERHRDVLEVGVAPDPRVLVDDVHGVVGPVLDGDEGQLGAVLEHDLDVLGPGGGAGVVDDDDGLAERAGADEQMAGGGRLEAAAGEPHRGGLLDDRVRRDGDLEDRRRGLPGAGRDAVDGHVAGRSAGGFGTGTDAAVTPGSGVGLDVEVVTGQGGVLVQPAESLERREPPDLLQAQWARRGRRPRRTPRGGGAIRRGRVRGLRPDRSTVIRPLPPSAAR